jgi:hypothetical protein
MTKSEKSVIVVVSSLNFGSIASLASHLNFSVFVHFRVALSTFRLFSLTIHVKIAFVSFRSLTTILFISFILVNVEMVCVNYRETLRYLYTKCIYSIVEMCLFV